MIGYMTAAVSWAVSRLLGVGPDGPLGHDDLQHAHWDRAARRWLTHQEPPELHAARAA
jgi:hypothetical protein